jgi:hypothetical protein
VGQHCEESQYLISRSGLCLENSDFDRISGQPFDFLGKFILSPVNPNGLVFSLKENAASEKRHLNKNSAASMVRTLVEKVPSGLLAAEIADALKDRIKNPTTIYSALHKLKTSGRLKYDSESKKYLPLASE